MKEDDIPNNDVISAVINALKAEFRRADWYDEVHEDIQTRLEWIIDNLGELGPLFCHTYMYMFHWEFERRRVSGQTITNPMAGYLTTILGMRISEEAYQCGVLPTRAILDLYDFTKPNDSDVTACMFLCNRIETMLRVGILTENKDKLKTGSDEIGEAFRKASHHRKKKNPANRSDSSTSRKEVIKWDFDDDA